MQAVTRCNNSLAFLKLILKLGKHRKSKVFENYINGMISIYNLEGGHFYDIDALIENGEDTDCEALKFDWEAIGKDFKDVIIENEIEIKIEKCLT